MLSLLVVSILVQNPVVESFDEIVVTAERREGPADEVPQSVVVIDSDQLAKSSIARLGDIRTATPAVQFKSIFGSSAPQIYIRGIGNTDVNPSANPGIAVYLDQVLVSSPLGQGLLLFDLERVEALKGPQGTLFGRNATGGALVLVPRRPTRDRGGEITGVLGSDGLRGLNITMNSGEIARIQARVSGVARSSDGYSNNLAGPPANEVDEYAARMSIEAQLSPVWTGRLAADFAADRSSMTAHEGRGIFEPGALANGSTGAPQLVPCSTARVLASECVNILGYRYSADPYTEGQDASSREDLDAGGASITFERQTGIGFRSTTSWRRSVRNVLEDTDASPLAIAELGFDNEHEATTQEFIWNGQTGRIDWRAGAFGLRETLQTRNNYNTLEALRQQGVAFIPDPTLFFLGPFRLDQTYRQEISSAALFADADVAVSHRLALTAGLRLTREETEFQTLTVFREVIDDPVLSPLRGGETKDDESSWRLAGLYRADTGLIFYGSVSRGFKSSNFNGGALFPFDTLGPVAPERITAFEVGLRTQRKGVWRADVSAYRYAYDGLQTFTFRPSPPPTRQVLDSGDAEVTGFDASVAALLPFNVEASLATTLLDARFTDFVDANGVDRSGNPLPNAPKAAVVASIDRQTSLAGPWRVRYSLSASFRSNVRFDTTNNPLLGSDERTLWDAGVALDNETRGFQVRLDLSNLTDEVDVVEALNIAEYGLVQQTYGPRRRIVVSVSKAF